MHILDLRLSFIADTKAVLDARMHELSQLRDQVRKWSYQARKIDLVHANNSAPGLGEFHIGPGLIQP